MAAVAQGEVDIELGGKIRTIRFGIAEVREIEKRLKSDIRAHYGGRFGVMDFVTACIHVGMSNNFRGVTGPQVDDWIAAYLQAGGSLDDLATKLMQTYLRSLGEDGKVALKNMETFIAKQAADRAREEEQEAAIPLTGGSVKELNAPPGDAKSILTTS